MEYTRRRVVFTARERADGQWRLACWLDDPRLDTHPEVSTTHAWKCVPLSFDEPTWIMLALIGEAGRYLKSIAENSDHTPEEHLDLWGTI